MILQYHGNNNSERFLIMDDLEFDNTPQNHFLTFALALPPKEVILAGGRRGCQQVMGIWDMTLPPVLSGTPPHAHLYPRWPTVPQYC